MKDIGLELKPSKTRISHTLNNFEGHTGFNFLGFNIKQFPQGKNQCGKTAKGKLLGFKTLIKPSKEKVTAHSEKLKEVIREYRQKPQIALISKLNPIIRGWCNYYSTVVSKDIFSKLSHLTYLKLKRWAERRHPNKSRTWVADRYWHSTKTATKNRNWIFADTKDGKVSTRLYNHADTPVVRHVKVKGEASPYDVKSSKDGSYCLKKDVPVDKGQSSEEPCEVKISRTVLKTSRTGDSFA